MSVRICPAMGKSATQDCFDKNLLKRADNNKAYWYILSGGENQELKLDYKLPAGVTCPNGCMLQWEWLGTQMCYHPCAGADDVESECGFKGKRYKMGGASHESNICKPGQLPETFFNCADIKIV